MREEIQFCKKYRQLFYPAKIILSLKNVFILLILILFGSFLHYFEANFLKLGNSRVGHSVLLRSERYDLSRSQKRTLRSFTFFSRVFGDL